MKKNLKFFMIWWAILFVIFNSVVLIVTGCTTGFRALGAIYWVSYVTIVLSFVGLLLCAVKAFASDSKELLYRASLIKSSYGNLIAVLVVGGLFMVLDFIPSWIGAVVCILIVGYNSLKVIKALAAAENVADKDISIKQNTSFTRTISAEAEALFVSTNDVQTKVLAKKVYEALRYSDPMSSPELEPEEERIKTLFSNFSANITHENTEALLFAIQARNIKCKEMK